MIGRCRSIVSGLEKRGRRFHMWYMGGVCVVREFVGGDLLGIWGEERDD